jgi:hypothetical protein
MSDKRIVNNHERQSVPQPMRTIVRRDPITKEFIEERVPLAALYEASLPAADEAYPAVTDNESKASFPERDSKKRLRRQRITHTALFAVTLSGLYTAGNHTLTSFNTGKAPNILEDVTQLPADLGKTYDAMKSAFDMMQSGGKAAEEIKKYIPENGDK